MRLVIFKREIFKFLYFLCTKMICITAKETTFYKLKTLKFKVEYYLKKYLINKKDRYIEIINVENTALIGAAIAGLTN